LICYNFDLKNRKSGWPTHFPRLQRCQLDRTETSAESSVTLRFVLDTRLRLLGEHLRMAGDRVAHDVVVDVSWVD
jgi:hypothetical protein